MATVSKPGHPNEKPRNEPEQDPMPSFIGSLIQRSAVAITNYVECGLRAAGFEISPPRAGNVMRNITAEGATIVAIARACGVSKQAVSRQAEALRTMGYVVVETSDADGRLKIVKPTAKGLKTREVATRLYEELEADLEKRVGAADVAAFRRVVAAIEEIGADAGK